MPNDELQEDKQRLIDAVNALGPHDKAVLAIVADPDGEDDYVIQELGTNSWSDVLGVLQSGISFAQAEMFSLKSREEEAPR
jgi:hypothetical protein